MGRIPIPCEAIIFYVRDEESSFDTLIAEKIKKLGSMPIPSSVITHKLETFDKTNRNSQPRSVIKCQRNFPSRRARGNVHPIRNIPLPRPIRDGRCGSHRSNCSSSGVVSLTRR